MTSNYLNILGIRGIPAAHGGFETFAAHFAPFMRDSGWNVIVYCQGEEGQSAPRRWEDSWNGITRIHFDTKTKGSAATIEFDLKCTLDVLKRPGVDLVLGYNTAIFTILQRAKGRRVIMNMDGIEWKRQKWGRVAKLWFWLNEWLGAKIANVRIADHPKIAAHLASRGCKGSVVIPYGSSVISAAEHTRLLPYGIVPNSYFVSIARIEPENSILEMVEAFVRADTGRQLVVLGKLTPDENPYHAKVKAAANSSVIFTGGIYDPDTVAALRHFCLAYLHGHQVGGTNPSLVEALGAANPIIAHDNPFNRWTAGDGQMFFSSIDDCRDRMRAVHQDADLRARLSELSKVRHSEAFTFEKIHRDYLNAICGA